MPRCIKEYSFSNIKTHIFYAVPYEIWIYNMHPVYNIRSGVRLNIKMLANLYRNPYYKDTMEILYLGRLSLYWDGPWWCIYASVKWAIMGSDITPGVGVTKAPFVNFSASKLFDPAKVPARLFASHSYLTGVTAAELRQHLSNMNVIYNS